jgi:hypothetical protein
VASNLERDSEMLAGKCDVTVGDKWRERYPILENPYQKRSMIVTSNDYSSGKVRFLALVSP